MVSPHLMLIVAPNDGQYKMSPERPLGPGRCTFPGPGYGNIRERDIATLGRIAHRETGGGAFPWLGAEPAPPPLGATRLDPCGQSSSWSGHHDVRPARSG